MGVSVGVASPGFKVGSYGEVVSLSLSPGNSAIEPTFFVRVGTPKILYNTHHLL